MYLCDICNKTFFKKFNLERHKLFECKNDIGFEDEISVHTCCPYCKKDFNYCSKLNRHLKSVKGHCYNIRKINNTSNKKRNDYIFDDVEYKKQKYKRKKLSQSVRIKIAASQSWKCKHCHMLFNEGGWDINHIIRVSLGGSNDISNLEALCKNCHGIVTLNERIRDGV